MTAMVWTPFGWLPEEQVPEEHRHSQPPPAHVPVEDRCWRCDARRAVEDSPAGLCVECRAWMRGETGVSSDGSSGLARSLSPSGFPAPPPNMEPLEIYPEAS